MTPTSRDTTRSILLECHLVDIGQHPPKIRLRRRFPGCGTWNSRGRQGVLSRFGVYHCRLVLSVFQTTAAPINLSVFGSTPNTKKIAAITSILEICSTTPHDPAFLTPGFLQEPEKVELEHSASQASIRSTQVNQPTTRGNAFALPRAKTVCHDASNCQSTQIPRQ